MRQKLVIMLVFVVKCPCYSKNSLIVVVRYGRGHVGPHNRGPRKDYIKVFLMFMKRTVKMIRTQCPEMAPGLKRHHGAKWPQVVRIANRKFRAPGPSGSARD